MQRWPSKRAIGSIRDKVRAATDRRYVGYSLETAVERVNPALRGWGNYFRYGNSARKFTTVDSYVHQRLARLASSKYGLSRRNWATGNRFDLEWLSSLGVYRLTGTVRRRVMAHA
jgi:RNA-directed DNA polymerase